MITKYICEHTNRLKIELHPRMHPAHGDYEMFNTAGVETEVGELLYGLVRMVKPKVILETGTHVGVSAAYMALALEENKLGKIATFEVIDQHYNNAQLLWKDLGISHRVVPFLKDALTFDMSGVETDFLFLDSEPHLRFDEFVKFYPSLQPGGLIVIHDLDGRLGHSGQTINNMYDWPWGDFRKTLGPYIKDFRVQTFSFPTPRGLTILQKEAPIMASTELLRGII